MPEAAMVLLHRNIQRCAVILFLKVNFSPMFGAMMIDLLTNA